jgi:hypothetical protein
MRTRSALCKGYVSGGGGEVRERPLAWRPRRSASSVTPPSRWGFWVLLPESSCSARVCVATTAATVTLSSPLVGLRHFSRPTAQTAPTGTEFPHLCSSRAGEQRRRAVASRPRGTESERQMQPRLLGDHRASLPCIYSYSANLRYILVRSFPGVSREWFRRRRLPPPLREWYLYGYNSASGERTTVGIDCSRTS